MRGKGGISGAAGEELAAEHLKSSGYRIVERNWRCRQGELDIVAVDGKTLVFVEVKARGAGARTTPLEAVDLYKQRKLIKAAKQYISEKSLGNVGARFDVVTVTQGCDSPVVEIIADAFMLEGGWE
ncbi:MAG: YraN family protein [Deltaproteobacteria bacterium]|nr:MAG: YraN family protein [Deltaproteobacteria bacterium]